VSAREAELLREAITELRGKAATYSRFGYHASSRMQIERAERCEARLEWVEAKLAERDSGYRAKDLAKGAA
jgi:hypothetical protein